MSVETNKAVVRRFLDEFWNGRNLAVADELVDPGYIHHDPSNPETHDRAGLKSFAIEIVTSFPDAHVTIEQEFGEGDLVAKRWRFRGTHQGSFRGIAPTNKLVEWTGITLYRIVDGKILETWWNHDMLGAFQQMGAIPEMAMAGAR